MATGARTVLERHRIGGDVRPKSGATVPSQSNVTVKGGGKGGTVVLITGVLFIGYLYFTRRLPNVLAAINTPADLKLNTRLGTVTPTTPGTGGLPPAPVPRSSIVPRTKRVRFRVYFPPPYSTEPLDIDVTGTAEECRRVVYMAVLQRTGSQTLATIYSEGNCRF